jgi:fermentation-respiration switch protein FrsA (DUF1100 family)
MERLDVTFDSHGDRCAAWLYLPEEQKDSVPCVVMAHGFASTREEQLARFGERFAQAGFAALIFDYRHFGDSEGEPRQLLDIGRQQDDYRAAVAYVRTRDELDPARIALWGSSFSGGHVVAVAAGDPSIAAVVSQSPFADGLAQATAAPPAVAAKLMALGLRDEVGARLGRPPVHVPVAGPPGSVAALTSPASAEGVRSILGEGSRWREEIAARVMLRITTYRPVNDAARVSCPLLVCVADCDDLTPPEPAVRVAERAARGELLRYECGHFDVYGGPWHDAMVGDQVAFLTRHLG